MNTENFFGGNYPILLHNSGSKGFHFVVDARFNPKHKPINLPELFGKVVNNLIKDENLKSIDTSIYDARRILRLKYSLNYKNGKEYVCLPLTDEQFENWKLEDMELDNVIKNVKLFKRGLLERDHNLKESNLKDNFLKFINEYSK